MTRANANYADRMLWDIYQHHFQLLLVNFPASELDFHWFQMLLVNCWICFLSLFQLSLA